jgi:hypothetical protein
MSERWESPEIAGMPERNSGDEKNRSVEAEGRNDRWK